MEQFRIGHSSYTGVNAPATVTGRRAAINELRNRGATRDDARRAVKRALAGSFPVISAGPYGLDAVELFYVMPD